MYRVFIKPSELVFRSFDIYEVNEYLLENKRGDYIFLKEYVVFSVGEFIMALRNLGREAFASSFMLINIREALPDIC